MKSKQNTHPFYLISLPSSVCLYEFEQIRKGKPYSMNIFSAYADYFFFTMQNLYRRSSFDEFLIEIINLGVSCDGIRLEKDYSLKAIGEAMSA